MDILLSSLCERDTSLDGDDDNGDGWLVMMKKGKVNRRLQRSN